MTRERLSEEDGMEAMLNEVSNAAANYMIDYKEAEVSGRPLEHGLDLILEPIMKKHVTAARLAEAAAENEACAKLCTESEGADASMIEDKSWVDGYHGGRRDAATNIRSRLTAPQVSALERVKAEAWSNGARDTIRFVTMNLAQFGKGLTVGQLEDYMKWLEGAEGFAALSAPAVPDGAAKEDGDGR